eukprot:gene19331-biopygen33793
MRYTFHGEYRCALDALDEELGGQGGTYDTLGFSLPDILRHERPKCQKQLSRAVLSRKHEMWTASLDPRSRVLTILNMASGEDRRPLASEWLTAVPCNARTVIPDAEYCTALRLRLDVPIAERGTPCRVVRGMDCREPTGHGRPVGQPCGKPMLAHADHAQACATRARDERHNAVADLCAAMYKEAGYSAYRETDVPGVTTSKNRPIRADVLARGQGAAMWQCAEVKIRHFFNSDGDTVIADGADVDSAMNAVEAGVHKHYGRVQVRPWVFTSLGRPGAGMCIDLRRLSRLRLQRRDVSEAVSLPSVQQCLLRRWRAELSCTLVVGNARVYAEAVQGVPAGSGREPARVDVQ